MPASGFVDDRFYNVVWREKSRATPRGWHVVWVRSGRDKPTLSRWLKPGERELRDAIFQEIDHAETYVRLATSGQNEGRFILHDA